VPVVGARAGGVPDVVTDGQDGFLVPFGAVDQIAERIGRLLMDRSLAHAMGARGRARVFDSLTFEAKYQRVLAVYERLVGGTGL
jgi:glycogen synthase